MLKHISHLLSANDNTSNTTGKLLNDIDALLISMDGKADEKKLNEVVDLFNAVAELLATDPPAALLNDLQLINAELSTKVDALEALSHDAKLQIDKLKNIINSLQTKIEEIMNGVFMSTLEELQVLSPNMDEKKSIISIIIRNQAYLTSEETITALIKSTYSGEIPVFYLTEYLPVLNQQNPERAKLIRKCTYHALQQNGTITIDNNCILYKNMLVNNAFSASLSEEAFDNILVTFILPKIADIISKKLTLDRLLTSFKTCFEQDNTAGMIEAQKYIGSIESICQILYPAFFNLNGITQNKMQSISTLIDFIESTNPKWADYVKNFIYNTLDGLGAFTVAGDNTLLYGMTVEKGINETNKSAFINNKLIPAMTHRSKIRQKFDIFGLDKWHVHIGDDSFPIMVGAEELITDISHKTKLTFVSTDRFPLEAPDVSLPGLDEPGIEIRFSIQTSIDVRLGQDSIGSSGYISIAAIGEPVKSADDYYPKLYGALLSGFISHQLKYNLLTINPQQQVILQALLDEH
ncbi:MAG: hypothetical protein ACK4PR_11160, partial [Gammaproteobacteria bacterium]